MTARPGKGMVAGLVATVVLSLLMMGKALAGIVPELNAVAMLTGMAHRLLGAPETPAVGWALHLLIGTVAWGGLFGAFQHRLPGPNHAVRGMSFSVLPWLAMMIVVMPLAGAGFFGLGIGFGAPVVTLVLHLVFGAVMGGVYENLLRGEARPLSPG